MNHGWIYAGDLEESNGRIFLRNAVWVFSWNSVGFASVIANPNQSGIDIRKCEFDGHGYCGCGRGYDTVTI